MKYVNPRLGLVLLLAVACAAGWMQLARAGTSRVLVVVAVPQNVYVPYHAPVAIALHAEDDTPGGPFTFTYAIDASPSHGYIDQFDAAAGTLRYWPSGDYDGPDMFTFTASTENGISAPAMVSLDIAPTAPPVVFDTSANVPHNTTWNIALVYNDYNYGGPFAATFDVVGQPSHGSVVIYGNFATYTPAAGYFGPDSFTFQASTANGTSNVATASLSIASGVPPVAQATSAATPYETPVDITLGATDDNAGGPFDFTYVITTLPSHGDVVIEGDVATYTPEADFSGADSFSFTAGTVNGTSAPAGVEVTVGPAPARLVLSIDDGRDAVHYGEVVDYVVTLANEGGLPDGNVSVAFSLSGGFDADYLHLLCLGTGAGATCEPDAADPLRFSAALPADRSLVWVLSVPVRNDAEDDVVELAATVSGAKGSLSRFDENVLVLFRDGFETAAGDGAPSAAGSPGAGYAIRVPEATADTATVLLRLRDGSGEVVVESRIVASVALVRLRQRDAAGRGRATSWSATRTGENLTLEDINLPARAGEDMPARVLVLHGAQPSPVLPMPSKREDAE